jgi:hypothetical protein
VKSKSIKKNTGSVRGGILMKNKKKNDGTAAKRKAHIQNDETVCITPLYDANSSSSERISGETGYEVMTMAVQNGLLEI